MQTADRLKFQPTNLKRKGPQYLICNLNLLFKQSAILHSLLYYFFAYFLYFVNPRSLLPKQRHILILILFFRCWRLDVVRLIGLTLPFFPYTFVMHSLHQALKLRGSERWSQNITIMSNVPVAYFQLHVAPFGPMKLSWRYATCAPKSCNSCDRRGRFFFNTLPIHYQVWKEKKSNQIACCWALSVTAA